MTMAIYESISDLLQTTEVDFQRQVTGMRGKIVLGGHAYRCRKTLLFWPFEGAIYMLTEEQYDFLVVAAFNETCLFVIDRSEDGRIFWGFNAQEGERKGKYSELANTILSLLPTLGNNDYPHMHHTIFADAQADSIWLLLQKHTLRPGGIRFTYSTALNTHADIPLANEQIIGMLELKDLRSTTTCQRDPHDPNNYESLSLVMPCYLNKPVIINAPLLRIEHFQKY